MKVGGLVLGLMMFLAGCANQGMGQQAETAHGIFEHLQFSATLGGLMFFDEDTGEIWQYQDPGDAGVMVAKLETLGRPMLVQKPEEKPAPLVIETKPEVPKAKPADRLNANSALVVHFNSMPKELWPSMDETGAVGDARGKWLENNKKPATGEFLGIIKDVSSKSIAKGKDGLGNAVYRDALYFDLDGGTVTIWGEETPLTIYVTFDSVDASEGLKWKKGQSVSISGNIERAQVSPFGMGIYLYIKNAKIE